MTQGKTRWLIVTAISFIFLAIFTGIATFAALLMIWEIFGYFMILTIIMGFIATVQLEPDQCPYDEYSGGSFI